MPWNDVHWPTLLLLSSYERADGELHTLLRAAPPGVVPEDVLHATLMRSRVASFRAMELADAAAVTCDALSAAAIDVLWLKGAALAMQSPDGFAIRAMGDLDLLVEPEALAAARTALLAAGWQDGGDGAGYDAHHHAAPLVWRGGPRLELHTGVIPPPHPFVRDSAGMWLSRSVVCRWESRDVRVLPPEWHAVHVGVHWAWNHEGKVGSWQYLHDMHALVQAGVEWSGVKAAADEIRAARPLGWGLWSAAVLGNVRVDRRVIQELRGPSRAGLNGMAEREWVMRAFLHPAASPSVRWSRYWWRVAMGGLGDADMTWPWAAGRTAGSAMPVSAAEMASATDKAGADRAGASEVSGPEGGAGLLARIARWWRHLSHVLTG